MSKPGTRVLSFKFAILVASLLRTAVCLHDWSISPWRLATGSSAAPRLRNDVSRLAWINWRGACLGAHASWQELPCKHGIRGCHKAKLALRCWQPVLGILESTTQGEYQTWVLLSRLRILYRVINVGFLVSITQKSTFCIHHLRYWNIFGKSTIHEDVTKTCLSCRIKHMLSSVLLEPDIKSILLPSPP